MAGNRTLFGFGGPAFSDAPQLAASIPGVFLDADLSHATREIRSTVGG
jgi:hypothetical protein